MRATLLFLIASLAFGVTKPSAAEIESQSSPVVPVFTPVPHAEAADARPQGPESTLLRRQYPISLSLNFGTPAPSIVGAVVGFQISDYAQALGGTGFSWWSDLRIQATEFEMRFSLVAQNFTPFFGAGFSFFGTTGVGNLQSLSETTLLGNLSLGLDWALPNALRLAAGVHFHYPLSVNFPFAELGIIF